ncbi:MAG: hypothetical protein ACRDQB_00430, partial [Thermocrispum sp.]
TYFFCIRPMRRGECATGVASGGQDAERAREIAELREEIRILRAEDTLEGGADQGPPGTRS